MYLTGFLVSFFGYRNGDQNGCGDMARAPGLVRTGIQFNGVLIGSGCSDGVQKFISHHAGSNKQI
jgi:hypothetical protein